MTTKQLSFKAPPQLAIAVGATTPDPGINGVTVWSTTANALVHWDSNSWELVGGTGGSVEDSIFKPISQEFQVGHSWWADGARNEGWSLSSFGDTFDTAPTTQVAQTGSTGLESYLPVCISTTTAAAFQVSGVRQNTVLFKRGAASSGGFVFEGLSGFSSINSTGVSGMFFMGLTDNMTCLYTDTFIATSLFVGIGGENTDNHRTTFRVIFGNGTTVNKSTLVTRPAGTRNNPIYKLYMRLINGGTQLKMWVMDYGIAEYPEGIIALNGHVVDVTSLPAGTGMGMMMMAGTGTATTAKTCRSFWYTCSAWDNAPPYSEAAANITGNAATADALTSLSGLPQGGATNNQVLTWNGTTWVPSTASGGSSDPLILTSANSAAPGSSQVKIFRRDMGGRQMPAFVGPNGVDSALQPHIGRNKISFISPAGNSTTITTLGAVAPTATGTATAANVATTNRHTRMTRIEYLVTTAAATAVAGWRAAAAQFTVGAATAGDGGFHYSCRFGPATGVATTTNRCFVGLGNSVAAPTDVQPSTITNIVGVGWDSADVNIQIMHRGTGAITKIDTTIPVPTVDRTSVFELTMFSPPGTTQVVYFDFKNLLNDTTVSGSIFTNLPTNTTLLAPRGWMSAGGTSSVIGIALMNQYIETDF
jgi:hypothetical protein